jgi:hypothetical protein
MEQQAQLALTKRVTTAAVLQAFRVAAVKMMGHTTALATTVVGGVVRSTLPQVPTSGSFTTMAAMWTGTTAVNKVVQLFAVCEIYESFDYLSI